MILRDEEQYYRLHVGEAMADMLPLKAAEVKCSWHQGRTFTANRATMARTASRRRTRTPSNAKEKRG